MDIQIVDVYQLLEIGLCHYLFTDLDVLVGVNARLVAPGSV